MEHSTDRLFWTLTSIIIGALTLTIGIKAFPNMASSALTPMSGFIQQADIGTKNVRKANNDAIDNALNPANAKAKADAVDPAVNHLTAQDNGDGTATITGHTDRLSLDLVIPSYIKMNNQVLKVTTIGRQAFQAAHITSLVLPDTVTDIADLAFYQTSWDDGYGLKSVHFGNQLQKIGWNAFANTGTLTTINTLPPTLESIPGGTFANTNIQQINVSKNTKFDAGTAFWHVPNLDSILHYY